ncbi:class I SAM-dependent methyltransferase [Candidatus Pelagibacter sp. HIMB1746]|uniref:class I SAM-dependent methyltransferase n=1 Tax=Candidatus Pelagibacter sp. HIMB1746 TaxID=3413370 RepID=UPI003F85CE87
MNKLKLRLNKFYNYIFGEKFYKKIKINWSNYPNRSDIIQKIIDYKNYKSYLEVGCDDDLNFNQIKIETKVGVDPINGGNIRKTSDEFFLENKISFDCIFIDGLHEYDQVKKDINNSLNHLNDGGIIFVHDCLPRSFFEQAVPRSQYIWTGDVWKHIVELRTKDFIDICVGNLDMGLGIILKRKNSNVLKLNSKNFKKLRFKEYYKNYQNYLNLIHHKQIINFIDK